MTGASSPNRAMLWAGVAVLCVWTLPADLSARAGCAGWPRDRLAMAKALRAIRRELRGAEDLPRHRGRLARDLGQHPGRRHDHGDGARARRAGRLRAGTLPVSGRGRLSRADPDDASLPRRDPGAAAHRLLHPLGVYDTPFGVALVHAVLATPFATLVCASLFMGIPRELEEAAWVFAARASPASCAWCCRWPCRESRPRRSLPSCCPGTRSSRPRC